MFGMSIVQLLILVVVIAAAVCLMWKALQYFGIAIPGFVIEVFWIVIVAIIVIAGIKVVAGMF